MAKKRYAQVGLGARAGMFYKALSGDFSDYGDLVALCDTNPGRMQVVNDKLPEEHPEVPMYAAEDFDKMVAEQKPDVIIVTTMDRYHDRYICRAMELGCDAITEKPMTIDAERCQRIIDTQAETGRDLRVTFNYRYSPPRSQVKEILMAGTIGKIISVDFHWMLNVRHGADYFRRWHRHKENSGGLMVHKATHHFDLVNWWISSTPQEVYATGARKFYGPWTAERYGFEDHAPRCLDCQYQGECKFYLDLAARDRHRELYLEQEHHDGYYRDRCVWSDEIDIEDTMAVNVRYANDVRMAYSLNAFMPWEGYTISFNGTKGRLEHKTVETSYVSGDGTVPGATVEKGTYIMVMPMHDEPYNVEIRVAEGGHGGGDPVLLNDVFNYEPGRDPLKRAAGLADGAWSILTGVAANKSMATGQIVQADQLVKNLGAPDQTEMKE